MIIKYVIPLLFVLLLPVVKAVLQYLIKDEVVGLLDVELFLSAVILIYGFFRYKAFRIIVTEKGITVKNGVFFKKMADIPFSAISSVQNAVTPFDLLFRSITYRINTEAGIKNRADFEFKLNIKDGKELSKILYGGKTEEKQRFSAYRVAIMAAATSSAFTGLVVGVPIINRAGNLFGIALTEMLLDEINTVSENAGYIFSPIVNTVTIILIIGYFIAFLYSFLKYINFKLVLKSDSLEVRSGIYEKVRTAFKKDSVNNVVIEQSPLMHLIKQYAMKVSVGGFGEGRGESQMVVPCGRRAEIKQDFEEYFPFLVSDGEFIRVHRSRLQRSRFLLMPSVYLLCLLGISFILSLKLTEFDKLILFLTVILLIVIFYYAYLSVFEYKYGQIRIGNMLFVRGIRFLRTRELYAPLENIGQITIRQFPMDRSLGTCTVKFVVSSESADSVRLRMVNYEKVKKELYKACKIEE